MILGDPRMRAYSTGAMAINADRTRIAVTEGSATRVWNVPAQTLAFVIPVGGTSPQFVGDHLGILPMHGSALRWWDASGHEVPSPYPTCTWNVASTSTKPGVVACATKSPVTVRVFGATEQTLAVEGLDTYEDVEAVSISPDGAYLAAATGYRVEVFELATGRSVWRRDLRVHDCLAFDHRGRLLVGDTDPHGEQTTLYVLNARDGGDLAKRTLAGSVEHCDMSPVDDAMLVVDPTANVARVFSVPALEPRDVLSALLPERNAVFGADGTTIYAQNETHVLEWNRDTHRWAASGNIGHLGDSSALAVSPGGDSVATVGTDGRLVLWPLDGAPPRTLRDGLDFALTAVAFSVDGKRIAVGSQADTYPDSVGPPDGKSVVEVWDVSSGKRLFRVKRSSASIQTLGFGRDGLLYVLGNDSELVALDAKTGMLRWRRWLVPHFGDIAGGIEVTDAAFSPYATAVMAWLSAGKDSTFVVQTMRGKDLVADGYADDARPRAAGFTADGRPWTCADENCNPTDEHGVALPVIPVVAQYSQFGPTTITPRRTPGGPIEQWQPGTRCHAFHPDGKRYVSCSADGLVRVWDVDRLRP